MRLLGHVVNGNGVTTDPVETQDILASIPPSDKSGVRKFLGLIGTYKDFIHNYSAKAEPLFKLTRKEVEFVWSPEHTLASTHLKRLSQSHLF